MTTAKATKATEQARAKAHVEMIKDEARTVDRDKPAFKRRVTIEFRGATFQIDADAMEDIEVLEAIEDRKFITSSRALLGAEQWEQVKNLVRTPAGRVPADALDEFIETVYEALDPTAPVDSSGT